MIINNTIGLITFVKSRAVAEAKHVTETKEKENIYHEKEDRWELNWKEKKEWPENLRRRPDGKWKTNLVVLFSGKVYDA